MGALRRVVVIGIALVLLFPVYYMAQGSLQPIAVIKTWPPLLYPRRISGEHYLQVFRQPHIGKWVISSVVVFVGYIGMALFVNGTAGYVFSFARFRGKEAVFMTYLAAMLIARMAILIPQFVVVNALRLPGMAAVLLMTAFSPGLIYILRNFFDGIPRSLPESAQMDGAGEWTIFRRIVLPVSKPIVGTVIVMKGIESLSDYIWQMLNLGMDQEKTLLVGLTQAVQMVRMNLDGTAVGFELAVGVVLLVPLLLLFAGANRYLIKGVMIGGVKE